MTRKYNSTRRQKAAERTRRDIVEAALKLHWVGITEFAPLAEAAGCSEATLRKHFPTKEDLFRKCTSTFAAMVTMPDLEALSAIHQPAERFEASVRELCRIHEAMFRYAWVSAHRRQDSAVLEEVMTAYDGLASAVTAIVVPTESHRASVVRGLLDFLTYRALRTSGGISQEKAQEALIATLRPLIPIDE
jgi:AcrR family transcriptional regulator